MRFKPWPVQGVYTNGTKPDRLNLDGQQRLTSLYLATFYGKPVDTQHARKKLIKRWYYIKMEAALKPDGDRDEAIVSLPEDRLVRNFRSDVLEDYSTREFEYKHGLFPFEYIFHASDWRAGFEAYWDCVFRERSAFLASRERSSSNLSSTRCH